MAFVFRSPRKIDQRIQKQSQISTQNNQKLLDESILAKKHQIRKGLASRNVKKQDQQPENCFYLAKDNENLSNIKNKPLFKNTKHNKSQQKQLHFFKSRSKRIQQNNNKDLKKKSEKRTNIKHSNSQFCLKSIEKQQDKNNISKNYKEQNQLKTSIKIKIDKQDIKKLPYLLNNMKSQIKNNVNLLLSKKKFNSIYAVPSIPGKDEKFGYVLKDNQLSFPRNVSFPRFQGDKQDLPGPTDYIIPQQKKAKGVLKFSPSHQKLLNPNIQNQFFALINDQQALRIHNQKIKKWVNDNKIQNKKIKTTKYYLKRKEREDLETRDLSVDSNESGLTVYQDTTTPGPGYYSSSYHNQKRSYRSKKDQFSKIFFSQSQRFQKFNPKQNILKERHIYNDQKIQEKSKNKNKKFFISKLQRKTDMENNLVCSPPPGYYNVRKSLQNDLLFQMIKSTSNVFSNKLPRLADTVNSRTPGPGYYNLDFPNFKVQQSKHQLLSNQKNRQKQTALLISNQQSLVLLSKQKNKKNIIHSREDSIIQQNYPPFLSTSPKGLNLQKKSYYQIQPTIYKQQKINKQNLHPFNSSQRKQNKNLPKYTAQVGLYQLNNINQQQQKSFNILFN